MGKNTNRGRQRGRRRPSGTRSRVPLVLVFCQGEVTEPDYFDLLKQRYRLKFSVKPRSLNPVKLVRDAISQAKHDGDWDEIYVVVDVDESSVEQIQQAARQCRTINGTKISLVVTNPCFEFWLLLHTDYHPVDGLTRQDAQRAAIQRGILTGKGNKAIAADFDVEGHENAKGKGYSTDMGELGASPSTAMPFLVERLMELKPKHLK